MATATGTIRGARHTDEAAHNALTPERAPESIDQWEAADETLHMADERLLTRAERERHLHMPTRIFGESIGDHLRRGARLWTDLPDVLPLGEEGGSAWTPDNWWLREDTVDVDGL
jgi:hypothetical protein